MLTPDDIGLEIYTLGTYTQRAGSLSGSYKLVTIPGRYGQTPQIQ
jgi:hypothetical protein